MSAIFGVIAPHPPIMVPEVGGSDAEVTGPSRQALSQAAEMLRSYDPDTVVLMSPHSPALADAFVVETARRTEGTLAQFGAAGVRLAYSGDPELGRRLIERLAERDIPAFDRAAVPALASGHLDHGVLVPMSVLDPEGRWPLLNLSLSYLSYEEHKAVGEEVAAAADDLGKRIAFVASGDLSHRLKPGAPAGYSPRAEELDEKLVRLVGESKFDALINIDPELVEAGGECGLRSFIALGGAAKPAHARVLTYQGPWGVGYLTAVVNEELVHSTPPTGSKGGAAGQDEHPLVALARRAIETYVQTGEIVAPTPLDDPDLPERAGTFVSLHRDHDLRGCIGTIAPTQPTLAEEVVHNAIQAATADPRFPGMGPDELGDLDVKVDVLHPPEGCEFAELDPRQYGVIVSCDWRRGLLLPDLEGVDSPEAQVAIACRKAGIGPEESVALERFRVDRYA